jgi:branched-chain amino acid transport system permease protein
MTLFLQQILSGVASGLIYGSLALALVVVFDGTGVMNFAQGEMAALSAYISWQLIDNGMSYWVAFGLTIVLSFLLGVIIERVLIRPVEGRAEINIVIVTLALLIGINALMGLIWGFIGKSVESPFGTGVVDIGGAFLTAQQIGMAGLTLVALIVVGAFFRLTPVGLTVRAASVNPGSARYLGINVGRMLAIGWGIAAAVGAVVGMATAQITGINPDMMSGVLLLAIASYVLGGEGSRIGAVVGGIIIGVVTNLGVTYVDWLGGDLANLMPFSVIILVLLVRPQGIFGRVSAARP